MAGSAFRRPGGGSPHSATSQNHQLLRWCRRAASIWVSPCPKLSSCHQLPLPGSGSSVRGGMVGRTLKEVQVRGELLCSLPFLTHLTQMGLGGTVESIMHQSGQTDMMQWDLLLQLPTPCFLFIPKYSSAVIRCCWVHDMCPTTVVTRTNGNPFTPRPFKR